MIDFTLTDHGSLVLLKPLTKAAKDWAAENIVDEHMTWGGAIVVEPRYVDAIIDGLTADGLSIK